VRVGGLDVSILVDGEGEGFGWSSLAKEGEAAVE